MIEFYYWPTPNGKKVAIMLEECGLDYALRPVDILNGEQFAAEFLAISPNNKIPAIVDRERADRDGPEGRFALFESGAILQYLAERSDRFVPRETGARYRVLEWLNFQVASLGPMLGQCGHFLGYAPERIPYAIERYRNEALRLYSVLDRRLAGRDWLAGDYSIADMAIYPWIDVRWLHQIDIDGFPNVRRWFERAGEREALRRGMALLADREIIGNPSDATREAFFGRTQREQGKG